MHKTEAYWSWCDHSLIPLPARVTVKWPEVVGKCLLHLVKVVGSPVVNIMAQSSSYHCKGFEVCVVTLQFAGLEGENLNVVC